MYFPYLEERGYVMLPYTYVSAYSGDTTIPEANQKFLEEKYAEYLERMNYEQFIDWLLAEEDRRKEEGRQIEEEKKAILVVEAMHERFVLCKKESEIYRNLMERLEKNPVLDEEMRRQVVLEKLEALYERLKAEHEVLEEISFEEFRQKLEDGVQINGTALIVERRKLEELIEEAREREREKERERQAQMLNEIEDDTREFRL